MVQVDDNESETSEDGRNLLERAATQGKEPLTDEDDLDSEDPDEEMNRIEREHLAKMEALRQKAQRRKMTSECSVR